MCDKFLQLLIAFLRFWILWMKISSVDLSAADRPKIAKKLKM